MATPISQFKDREAERLRDDGYRNSVELSEQARYQEKGGYGERGGYSEKAFSPKGGYGDRKGLTEEHCSGFCPAGYQCAWNTTIPKQCPPGHYSSGGWAFCVACPRSKGTESHQTCRTGRKCCNM